MKKVVRVIIFILIFLIGCDNTSSIEQSVSSAPPSLKTSNTENAYQEHQELTPIPDDITYKIIYQSAVPGIKRSLDIRLNKRVSKDVLKSIAFKLKDSDPNIYERTFISYYLPDMEVGAGGWATTHFNPNLKVFIYGLTVEQEQEVQSKIDQEQAIKDKIEQKQNLIAESKDASVTIVGKWLDETPFFGNITIIFHQNGKPFMKNIYNDGSSGLKKLIEKKSSRGRHFEEVGGSEYGDHYLLDSSGNLQLRDNMGLIRIAKKLN
jgi:hypothetical protein